MKHTKGTWEPFSYHNLDIAQEGVRYGVSSSNGKYIGEEMTEGDAHLIANAPEMLAMLKELCYKWIEKSNGGQKLLIDDNSINQELLHLIAKAEGGE
jgi:hypothetical protein